MLEDGFLEPAIGTSSSTLLPGEFDLFDGVCRKRVWGGDEWGLSVVSVLVGHKTKLHDGSVLQREPEGDNRSV